MSTITRRRAVYAVLSPHLEDQQLMDALWLWQKDYADMPKFALKHFAEAICDQFQTPMDTRQLQQELIRSMDQDSRHLPADPLVHMQAYREHKRLLDSPDSQTFAVLMVAIGRQISGETHPDFPNQCQRSLAAKGFEAEFINPVLLAIKERKPRLAEPLAPLGYTQALNAIYIALCEALGPSKADQTLSQAVEEVDKSKFGKRFSPRDFL